MTARIKDDFVMVDKEFMEIVTESMKRVQELEEVAETDGSAFHTIEKLFIESEQQNKRYREAFKQIKLQILFDGAIEDHRKNIIEIIDEALVGEE